MKVPPHLTGLAFFASVNVLGLAQLAAQSDSEQVVLEPPIALSTVSSSPTPAPVDSPQDDPSVTVVFGNGGSLTTLAAQGLTALIGIGAAETVIVQTAFPSASAGEIVLAQSLDGGVVTADGAETTIDVEGRITLNFTAGDKPGLYRLSVRTGENISIIQFWVPNPADSSGDPPVLTPDPPPAGGE
jgi:hypothetical protein